MNNRNKIDGIDFEILKRYFSQKCNISEKEKVNAWFRDPKLEKTLKYKLRNQWEEIDFNPPGCEMDSKDIFNQIYHNIQINDQNILFYQKFYKTFSKIAAILLLPLLFITGWYYINSSVVSPKNLYTEVFAPPGTRTHFELPDGSAGWLNSGSKLKFPVRFTGSRREVLLTGEGFFNVTKNKKKPFVVKAGMIEVIALGTQFNVMSFPDDKTIVVTLETGGVALYEDRNNKKPVYLTKLAPNQQMTFFKEPGRCKKKNVNARNYTSWKQGMLVFRNEPMNAVFKRLERRYNVKINIRDKEIENYRYRATFEDESFDEVIKLIKLTSPIDYEKSERVKLPDGSFSKKEVTFFMNPEYQHEMKQ